MTEFLIAALLIILACAVYLAWKLDEERRKLDQCQEDWSRLYRHLNALSAEKQRAQEELARFQRWVTEKGAADPEVARLRAANARLSVQLGQLSDRVQDYKDGLYEAGHHDELQAFQKYLDGEYDDIIH